MLQADGSLARAALGCAQREGGTAPAAGRGAQVDCPGPAPVEQKAQGTAGVMAVQEVQEDRVGGGAIPVMYVPRGAA